jgi:signal transduction histidine kinase
MNLSALSKKDPRYLLHVFVYGSLLVLLACLFGTAFVFSATYLKKESSRAAISTEQLSHFFDFQYRSVTEEMWTQNYEAINLRIGSIARQLGHAGYNLVLTDESGGCVYASSSLDTARPCEVPELLKNEIPKFRPGPPKPTLNFNNVTNQYVYMVPLKVGAVSKGYLYAAISDPYEFYRGNSLILAIRIFIIPIACVVFVWLMWLVVSKRFILRPYLSSLVEMEKKQALGDLAAQVAHDVRSPAETIKSVVRKVKGIDPREARLLIAASSRIENIADDLITKFIHTVRGEPASFSFLSAVVDSIVAEKIAILGDRSKIEIRSNLTPDMCLVGVPISGTELSRVLSNVLNNAIHALRDKQRGIISITASSDGTQVSLQIKDNGKGISEEVLHKLRSLGGSFGKVGGAGIGLAHGKSALAKVGGSLSIDSSVGKGTTITLQMPTAPTPSWCATTLNLSDAKAIVVLDDDESIHLLWRERLGTERIHYLTDPEQFDIARFPPETTRYIFDHDICGSPVTGLDLIRSHNLSNRAVLVTSYFNETKIQRAVEQAGAAMLPKFMISKVPILLGQNPERTPVTGPTESYDLVLIDDDLLVHDLWAFDAAQSEKKILTVSTAEEFDRHVIDTTTKVYVDKNLAKGASGFEVAKDLYARGYRNLYLTTGEAIRADDLPKIFRGVIGKSFPVTQ